MVKKFYLRESGITKNNMHMIGMILKYGPRSMPIRSYHAWRKFHADPQMTNETVKTVAQILGIDHRTDYTVILKYIADIFDNPAREYSGFWELMSAQYEVIPYFLLFQVTSLVPLTKACMKTGISAYVLIHAYTHH